MEIRIADPKRCQKCRSTSPSRPERPSASVPGDASGTTTPAGLRASVQSTNSRALPCCTWPRVSPISFDPRSSNTTFPSTPKVSVAVMQVVMPGSEESIAVSRVQSMKAPLASSSCCVGSSRALAGARDGGREQIGEPTRTRNRCGACELALRAFGRHPGVEHPGCRQPRGLREGRGRRGDARAPSRAPAAQPDSASCWTPAASARDPPAAKAPVAGARTPRPALNVAHPVSDREWNPEAAMSYPPTPGGVWRPGPPRLSCDVPEFLRNTRPEGRLPRPAPQQHRGGTVHARLKGSSSRHRGRHRARQ